MSESEPAAQSRDMSDEEFINTVRRDGVTLNGKFYSATGVGRQTRYHAYDPGLVKGQDPVRDDDGDVAGCEVANHEEALLEDVTKDELLEVGERYRDGFGAAGVAYVETSADDGSDGGSTQTANDFEPMDEDETVAVIRENYADHGFSAEDDDGKEKVVSLAHPGARLMGYITGSHVGSLNNPVETVDDYRNAVFHALEVVPDEPEGVLEDPDDVPVAPDSMMEVFRESGNSIDDETRDKISQQVKARWQDGEYDHLRKDDEADDETGEVEYEDERPDEEDDDGGD